MYGLPSSGSYAIGIPTEWTRTTVKYLGNSSGGFRWIAIGH